MSRDTYQIWLFRHGATEWSESGRHTGRTDLPLTDWGREQAAIAGCRVKGRSFALVLSSPLARALESCWLAGYGDRVRLADELMEWDYGDYEGRRTADIREERSGWSIWREGVPNGETLAEVGARADEAIRLAQSVVGDVALFSHGHLLRVLGARWLGLPPAAGRHFALDTGAISVLGFQRGKQMIERWNDNGPLASAKAP